MSRFQFRGKNFIDTILDVPIVLPPLVIGLGLLILFNNISFGTMEVVYFDRDGSQYIVQENRTIERMIQQVGASIGFQMRITNGAAGVVLAQFMELVPLPSAPCETHLIKLARGRKRWP